jgi:hypothetical protein
MKRMLHPLLVILGIILYGLVFLVPFSGAVHLFDWDEIIFAESAREMIISGDYMTVTINYEPFWEKPPLFIWLQAISMKIFGINEFAARFPNAICGILTLVTLFLAGRKVHGQRFGLLWSMTYATAVLPFFYFQTGIIDPWFNFLILLGVLFFIFFLEGKHAANRYLHVALSAFFLGLAVLTKGPVAVLIFVLAFAVFLLLRRGKINAVPLHVVVFSLVLLLTGGSWFLLAILNGNMDVVREFIAYQAGLFSDDFAGHGGFPGFHFVILLFGTFPASVIMLSGITKKREDSPRADTLRTWMYILLALVLLIFSLVQTKLVHYSSLAWFPVTFLSAWVLHLWLDRKMEIRRWQVVFLGAIGVIFVAATIVVPSVMIHPELFTDRFPQLSDPYVTGVLHSEAGWGVFDYLPALLLAGGLVYALPRIRKRERTGVLVLHLITFLFTFSLMLLYVPKVERMIQGPSIDFLEKHAGTDHRVVALGYKSFAPYFYGEWMPGDMPGDTADWINVDRDGHPLYVVMKADNSDKVMQKYPRLMILEEQGGFVFAILMPDPG